jgi:hypothetical protein
MAFKIFIEGNESVCFCWEVIALLKPLAVRIQVKKNSVAKAGKIKK